MRPEPAGPTAPARRGILAGAIVVALGATFLLQALRFPAIGSLLFITLGVAFAAPYVQDRRRYIYLMPAAILSGIGAGLLIPELLGATPQAAGPIFLLTMATAFAAVYLLEPAIRWPVVPAGVFAALALTSAFLSAALPDALRTAMSAPFATPVVLIAVGIYVLVHE